MRKGLLAVAAAGVSLTLVACGQAATSSSSSAPADAGTLTIWADETRIEALAKLGEDFKTASGVTLEIVQKPTNDIKKEFIDQVPTGSGPDLIVGAHDWTGDFVANGVISPVELGDAASGFNEQASQAFTMDGQLYGVPYAMENIGLVRNNALASETPDTFDELVAAKPAEAEYPILIQQGETGDAYHLYPLQTSFGAPVFKTDANGEFTTELGMGGTQGEAFAAYLKKLSADGVLSASIGGDQAKQAFLDGKSPYIITGPWWTGDFASAGLDITVLPIPSAGGQPSAPFIGVQGVYLSSKTENALLANQFLTYLASAEAQDALYKLGGRMPALTESADKVDDEILKGFAEAGAAGQPMPAIPAMGAVWTDWGGAEVSIINGSAADPAAAWRTMVTNLESKIASGS